MNVNVTVGPVSVSAERSMLICDLHIYGKKFLIIRNVLTYMESFS